MNINPINRLPGMRDVGPEDYRSRDTIIKKISSFLQTRNYDLIDTPVIEDTELLVRKSGGEFISQMYTFVDPGGRRVSLRPEFTSSVIRHFIQNQTTLQLPVKFQYGGPVFRYNPGSDGKLRQFTQYGAELIGSNGVDSDAEILYTAWSGLEACGLQNYKLKIGHLGVLQSFLANFDLSEPAKMFVIGNVQQLKNSDSNLQNLMQNAEEAGILWRNGHKKDLDLPEHRNQTYDQEFVVGILTGGLASPAGGRRTLEEIAERLIRKIEQRKRPERLKDALVTIGRLVVLNGDPMHVIGKARNIMPKNPATENILDQVEYLCETIVKLGINQSQIELDLGLVRGLAYYTGMMFDLVTNSSADELVLGGGGRYNALVRALGGEDIPALGFAYSVEKIMSLQNESDFYSSGN